MEEEKKTVTFTIERIEPYSFKINFHSGSPLTWTFYLPNSSDPTPDLSLEWFVGMIREILVCCARSMSIQWTPDGIKWEGKLPKSVDDIFPKDN